MKRVMTVLFAMTSTVSIILASFSQAWAQSQTEPQPESQVNVPATNNSAVQSRDDILRLEETIRANKEQPQVLTIVPWQLPTHQRIDETKAWQPVVDTLPSIERSQFLRDLAVVDDMLALSAAYAQGKSRAGSIEPSVMDNKKGPAEK